jgi:FtsP/CotA-like multicopper oxidase with cupredoxin domain
MSITRLISFIAIVLSLGLVYSNITMADDSPDHIHDQDMGNTEQSETMDMTQHDHAAMGHAIPDAAPLSGATFTSETVGLPDATPTDTVILKDGDSYNITAAYVKKQVGNRTLRMLAYNGSVPGPIIKAAQGSEVRINFINKTDIEQTIHSHGLRVDNRYDGVPGLTQDSVPPGDTFTYTLKFKDAGVFWYHPHTRDDYGQEMGLYGNYLIEPSEPGYWNLVNREIPLVIDDILIEDNQIAKFYKDFTNFALLGRFGNEYLVNGQDDFALQIKKGEVIRFFLTNVSNARTYNLSLPNVQLKIVGADLGKFEHEIFTENFLISPAERIVVEAYFKNTGNYQLTHTQPDGRVTLTNIIVTDSETKPTNYSNAFAVLRHNNDVVNEFKEFRNYLNFEPDKKLLLTIELAGQNIDHSVHTHTHTEEELHNHSEHAMNSVDDRSQYQPMTPTEAALNTIQWSDPDQSDSSHRTPEIFWKLIDEDTGKTSMDIDDWVFNEGELIKIRITNDKNADHIMQHPVHFHGQQFVVLTVDNLPNINFAWKDTVLVYPGQTMDLLVKMSNTGEWMAHCHISEHLHAGMMLKFRVENEDGYAIGDDYRSNSQSEMSKNLH